MVSPGWPPEPGTDVLFVECSDCTAPAAHTAAIEHGDGIRYVFDLRSATIAEYRVAAAVVREAAVVDREAAQVARSLASARLAVAGAARQTMTFSVPIAELGTRPGDDEAYVPWQVARFNGNYNAWASIARRYFASESFAHRCPEVAALMNGFDAAGRLTGPASELTPTVLSFAGRIALQSGQALARIKLEALNGDYVLIEMGADGLLRYAGAYDANGAAYRDLVLNTDGRDMLIEPER